MTYTIQGGKISGAQRVVIYGPEGIGKSTLAAAFPSPLFIDVESGTRQLDVQRLDTPREWAMLIDEVLYISEHPSLCRTLVIDTADRAEALCVRAICEGRDGIKGLEDFGYGKGYTYLKERFTELIVSLDACVRAGINAVVVAHAAMRKFEQPNEAGSYDRWELKLEKKTAPLLKEWADLLLFCTYDIIPVKASAKEGGKVKPQGGQRVMYTTHHPCWDAKNRHGLPEKLPLDYDKISHLFPAVAVQHEPPPVPEEETAPVMAKTPPAADAPDTRIDARLRERMTADGVTEEEIRRVVASKKHFPQNMPVYKYPAEYIEQCLLPQWAGVLASIRAAR